MTAPASRRLTVDHPVQEGQDHLATERFRDVLGERDRFQFPTYRLDTVGIPSWWTIAATGDAGVAAIGHGYGGTDADARRSSWGESAELGLLRRTVSTLEHRRASRDELVAELGADAVLDPPSVCLLSLIHI